MLIKFSKTALKFLQKLDKNSVERLRNAIQGFLLWEILKLYKVILTIVNV